MLLGVNLFDFSGVVDDPCTSSLTNKLVKIKVTACGSGQFTCDDGQCVPIDERCNQISNCRFLYIFYHWISLNDDIQYLCRDESDEDGCKMLVMKENYNKKISPFDFDYESSMVIPVNVNISMAVMDILSISETDLVYVLKFRFLMVWYDNRLGWKKEFI